jgi:crossover junction endodeoxyribonuclease RusA
MTDTTGIEGSFVPFETTLRFDWPRPPLSMNDNFDRFKKRKLIKEIRAASALAAARLPALGKCRVTLTWFVVDRRRRDAINVCATFKPLADGLVDAGVVIDDAPAYMDTLMPTIVWLDKKAGHVAHLEMHIERLAA